jgi:hypothetical protein
MMVRKDWKRIALLVLGVVGIALLYVGNAVVTTLAIAQIGLVHSFLRSLPEVRVEAPEEPKSARSTKRDSSLPTMHQLVTDAKRRRRD